MTEKYLSEASRLDKFEYNKYNSIIAPVGSGKTTYTGSKLPKELDYKGLYVYLAPYRMLKDQVIYDELFEDITTEEYLENQDFKIAAFGKPIINNNYIMRILESGTGKIAMTPHSFFNLAYKNPDIMDNIGVIVIDEDDHVFSRLPNWENEIPVEDRIFEKAQSFLLDYLDKVLIIGITATGGDKLEDIWHIYYNNIRFKEKLKSYKHQERERYSDIKLVFNDTLKYKGKTAIFINSVNNMLRERKYLESQGYKVDMIVSDNAKNYSMTEREEQIKEELATTGISDKIRDILIFNAAMERGVSLKDHENSFKNIIVHSSNEDVQTQVIGRFRYNGMNVWRLKDKESRTRENQLNYVIDIETGRKSDNIIVPDKYLDIYLTTELKDKLIEEIGYSRGWTTLSRELTKRDYIIKNKRVKLNGDVKRTRVSIISKK